MILTRACSINEFDELLTTEDAVKLMRCSRTHFFGKILKDGLLTPIRYGSRRMRFRRDAVIALLLRGYY